MMDNTWAVDFAKKLKPREDKQSHYVIATIVSKTPFKMIAYGGEIVIEDGEMLFETKSFNLFRTQTDETDLIGKTVLLIGTQKYVAIEEVV